MGNEAKVIGFAATVCVVCSLILSTVYSSLKERRDANKANDLKIKVLQAFGVEVRDEKNRLLMNAEEVSTFFAEQIEGKIIDGEGQIVSDRHVEDLTKEEINDRDPTTKLKRFYPYYIFTDKETGKKGYGIHISGMGLWSVLKGYLCFEDDFTTIAGLAFYDHKETPGLGGEVDKKWFSDQFPGKVMVENEKVLHFRVLKPGSITDSSSVHGPSGATITSKGITRFINRDYAVYHKHFRSLISRRQDD